MAETSHLCSLGLSCSRFSFVLGLCALVSSATVTVTPAGAAVVTVAGVRPLYMFRIRAFLDVAARSALMTQGRLCCGPRLRRYCQPAREKREFQQFALKDKPPISAVPQGYLPYSLYSHRGLNFPQSVRAGICAPRDLGRGHAPKHAPKYAPKSQSRRRLYGRRGTAGAGRAGGVRE